MSLNLSNPKTFLPLLLFIGFVFALIGIGWQSITADSRIIFMGGLTMSLAIFLWILFNRQRLGIE
jgi:hypothetical protein